MRYDRRPVTYEEWRELYQQCLSSLGYGVWWQWKMKQLGRDVTEILFGPFDARSDRLCVDRVMWRRFDQLRRIKKRLEAEHEAGTSAEAILKMLRDHS